MIIVVNQTTLENAIACVLHSPEKHRLEHNPFAPLEAIDCTFHACTASYKEVYTSGMLTRPFPPPPGGRVIMGQNKMEYLVTTVFQFF